MQLEKILSEYGLRDKEAKVYLSALQVGSGSVLKIAEKANLARSTTELLLKKLKARGLVSSFKRKSGYWYNAEDPRQIVASLKNKTELVEKALPKLLALYGTSLSRPVVRFYEGRAGIKLVFEEILVEAVELISFGSADELFNNLDFFPEFVERRIKAKIPVKTILVDSEKARERQALGLSQLREVRLIGPEHASPGVIYIWKNKVAMFSLKENLSAVVIESEELTQVQRSLFLNLWGRVGEV